MLSVLLLCCVMFRQGFLSDPWPVVAVAAFGQVVFCALARRFFLPVLPGRRACSRPLPTGLGLARLGYSQLRIALSLRVF